MQHFRMNTIRNPELAEVREMLARVKSETYNYAKTAYILEKKIFRQH